MTNLIFVTDSHFRAESPVHRKDNILETQLKKMEWILQFASKNNAKIIHGGDMFDKPSPLDFVGNKVAELFDKYKIDIYYIFGNHDITGGNTKFFDYGLIGMFRYYKWFHFLHDKIMETDDCYVFGFDFNKETECVDYISYEDIVDPNKIRKGTKTICVVHNMITDDASVVINNKNKTINWREVNSGADVILCGHFHPGIGIKKDGLTSYFVNPGAMVRLEASDIEISRKPEIVLIKIDKPNLSMELVTIPHEKEIFDVHKVKLQKSIDEEKNKLLGALEILNDEDMMAGNMISILGRLTVDSMPEELKGILSEKIVERCKEKLLEIADGS